MGERKLKIAFDCDEVLYPFVEPFLYFFNPTHGTHHARDQVIDYPMSLLGVSKEDMRKSIGEFHRTEESKNLGPFDDAVSLIELLHRQGHQIFIVSGRKEDLREITVQSVARDFRDKIPFENIRLTSWADPEGKKVTKASVMSELDLDVLIEDCYENAVEAIAAGHKVILLNRPWNSNDSHKDVDGLIRVNSLQEAHAEILKLASN